MVVIIKYNRKYEHKKSVIIKTNILCNTFTNPLLNLIIIIFGDKLVLILEILVILCESFLYHKVARIDKKESLCISIILNLVSYLIGVIWNSI